MLELDWLALGVAVKYQLPLDNSPQSTLMWKRHQAFSTHGVTEISKEDYEAYNERIAKINKKEG